ncbi:hypothetical protein C2G38_2190373 [Gigaspora rosea]|uniref:Uncharacterized protein n=1 Tax=Gigaspora rosea TaxID=44941 RepID=A0A397V2Z9_9GLOM|nr:hypothetical protein C2G38_2190373 [Gigaspora rosea]
MPAGKTGSSTIQFEEGAGEDKTDYGGPERKQIHTWPSLSPLNPAILQPSMSTASLHYAGGRPWANLKHQSQAATAWLQTQDQQPARVCRKTNQGDNGIDLIVLYKGYIFLVQCKNYDEDNTNHGNAIKGDIMKFEGAMSW